MQNGPGGRFRWYKANCTEYNRAPLRAGLSPFIVLLSLLLLAPLPQYASADTLAPPLPPHRIAAALPCPPTNERSAAGGVGSGKGPSLQDSDDLRPGTVGRWCGAHTWAWHPG